MSDVIIFTERKLTAAAMRWKWLLVLLALGLAVLTGAVSSPLHSSVRSEILNIPMSHTGGIHSSSLKLVDSPDGDVGGGPPGI